MTSNTKEVFLIRIPSIDKKWLDGGVIDLNRNTATVTKNTANDGSEPQIIYEVDRNQNQENINLVKLNKTSGNEFKADVSTKVCGYIQFRVKRNIGSDSEQLEPLPKRHVVESIDNFIKSPVKPKQSSKKNRRKHL